jgi:hypothetical protein
MVRQDMSERNISFTTQEERQEKRGGNDEKIVKLMTVRRRNRLTGELYIDRFYFTIPFKDGLSLMEKGYILFRLEIQGDGKIILTPVTPIQPQGKT